MGKAGVGSRESGVGSQKALRGKLLVACCLLVAAYFLMPSTAYAQKTVDRMVATVDGGTRVDLITYSDLLWQIALQPNSPLENPASEELNRALNLLINQRLILQEAEKLPAVAPSNEEVRIASEILSKQFPSIAELQKRMERVGLSSEQLREIVRQRVVIEKYLDFRFRSFVVITPQQVADYYKDVYVPRFRQQSPGRIVPTLEEVRAELEKTLAESKIESDTDEFIQSARERAVIVILSQV